MPFTAGNEFTVNQTTDLSQTTSIVDGRLTDAVVTNRSTQSIGMDANGNIIVTWSSQGQDAPESPLEYGVYARRYDATTRQWGTEFLVNQNLSTTGDARISDQLASSVAMDDEGDFIITWTNDASSYEPTTGDTNGRGIYARRYNRDGTPAGDQFLVNTFTTSDQIESSVAMDADGDFVVTWTSRSQDAPGSRGIYARRYNKDGTPLTAEIPVNTTTADNQIHSSVAMDANGNFVVVWQSNNQAGDAGWGIYAQRFNADGTKNGAEFRVNTLTTNDQRHASVSMDATGNFVIAWDSNEGAINGREVYARRYDSSGNALDLAEFRVNLSRADNQEYASVKMLKTGGFLVSWTDVDASGTGIYARRYGANGLPVSGADGDPFLVNQTTPTNPASQTENQTFSAIGADAAGNVAVVWTGEQSGSDDVYIRNYTNTSIPNIPPTDITLSPITINENVAAGSLVGLLGTVDTDDTIFSYTFVTDPVNGADNAAFTIVGNELRINNSPNFEAKSQYAIRIRTTDSAGGTFDESFVIGVINLNEAPTDITIAPVAFNENIPAATAVGTLSTLDPDGDTSFIYTLLPSQPGNDNSFFTISGNQLLINASPNFEAKSSYTVLVQSSDLSGLTVQKSLTLTVTNLNERPTAINLSKSDIDENAPASSLIGTFATVDEDQGDTFVYTLVTDPVAAPDSGAFTIVNNELRINASPDFETKPTYRIRVRVTDQGGAPTGLSFEQDFTIRINDLNDPPANLAPTDVTLNPAIINENVAANTDVSTLITTDPNSGDTFTYTLVSGVGDIDNAAFAIAGNQLQFVTSPNFELKNSYQIRIRTTDQGGLSVEKELVVTINDLNEAPTDIRLTPDSVDEEAPLGTLVGNLSAVDQDNNETFVYQFVGTGNDNASFTLTPTGELSVNTATDFETKDRYAIRVRVTDKGGAGLSFEKDLTVNIKDVAEPGSPTDINIDKSEIAENSPANSVIGTLSTVDTNPGTFVYTIDQTFGDAASFSLNGDQLILIPSANFEAKSTYRVRIITRNTATNLTFTEELPITITDVNEVPTDLNLNRLIIDETNPANSVVGTFTTTDVDANESFNYTIVGGADAAAFTITGNQLTLVEKPNFETKPSYAIRVRTTDKGGLFFEKDLTLTVRDIGEAPTDLALSKSDIDENVLANSLIGTFTTTDPDANERFTYTLVAGGPDNGAFTIVNNELRINASPNFEVKPSYVIRVRTTDKDGLFFEKDLTITINNVNEAPLGIRLAPTIIDENRPPDTAIGTLETVDSDRGDTFTYTLVTGSGSTDNSAFRIDGNQLRLIGSADFETKPSYRVRIRTTDASGLFFEQELTVEVRDLPEFPGTNPPIDIGLSSTQIDENRPADSVVGTLSTTDPDQGDSFTYELVAGGADNAAFTIVNNELRIRDIPNFEVKPTYTIRIKTTDRGGLFLEKDFTITVRDLPETPGTTTPQDLQLSNNQLDENQPPNSLIGTFTTVDPDVGDTFTYTLVNGSGSADNAAFTIVNNELRIRNSPDFEAKSTYSIRVRTTDVGGLFFEKIFTVNIRDLPETPGSTAPQDLNLSSDQIDENSLVNTVVGTLSTVDPDAGDTFIYTLVDGGVDNDAFTIVNNELRIRNVPDFETKPTYTIRVRTTDSGGLTFEKNFTITVRNLPETPGTTTPQDILLSNNTIDENRPSNSIIGAFSTVDPDVGDSFTYSLIPGGRDNDAFTIVGNELRIKDSPDFETKITYVINVRTTDVGGRTFDKIFTIIVNDLPETPGTTPPRDLLLSRDQIDENSLANTTVGTFRTVDPDFNDTFTYTLVGGEGSADNGAFTIVNNELKINAVPNFEAKSSYSIRVRTADVGGLSFEKIFTIRVNDLPETPGTTIPQDLLLSNNRIDENRPANSLVGTFSTLDPDVGDSFTYALVAGAGGVDNAAFTIINGNELRLTNSLDFEAKPSYSIRVSTTDVGGLVFEKVFTINVNDLPELPGDTPPTDLLLSRNTIDERVPAGTTVGQLSTIDPDRGDTFTYTLEPGFGDNAAFTIAGDQLRINVSPDFEAKPSYSIRVITTDSGGRSLTKTLTIAVNDLSEPPTLTASAGGLSYTENSGDVAIDPGIEVTDIDSPNLQSATVRLAGYVPGQDFLGVRNSNGLTVNFDAGSGILTLTGSAPLGTYRDTLRSVTYRNSSNAPNTATRTAQITVRDEISSSNLATKLIQVIPLDTAPLITTSTGNLSYLENSGEVAVDAGLSVTDPDSPTLSGATVQLVGYVRGEDRLTVVTQNSIISNFDAATGTLTLVGRASAASYQAVLRSVAYLNTSGSPNTTARAVQFSVRDNGVTSNVATRGIQVIPTDSAPVVTASGGGLSYSENAGNVAVDPQLRIVDADSQTLVGATVRLQGYVAGQDSLSVTTPSGIQSNFNAATGELTLTGSASVASYQAALRSVTYSNSSDTPNTAARTVEFRVRDSAATSNLASRSIQILPLNDAPVLKTSLQEVAFVRGSTLIDAKLTVTDVDNARLTGATIKINNYIKGEDNLLFKDQNNIRGNFDAEAGVLRLTGSGAVISYQTALRSIRFANNRAVPTNIPRTLELQVNDGLAGSDLSTGRVQVVFSQTVNVPGIDLNGSGVGLDNNSTFILSGAPITIVASDARFTNQSYPVLTSATVSISNLQNGADEKLSANTTGTGITATYDEAKGILTLTGRASLADYQRVLRSVEYGNTNPNADTTTRTILFRVNNGASASEPSQTKVQISQINLEDGRTGTLETTPATDLIDAPSSDDTVRSILSNLQQDDDIVGGGGTDMFMLLDGEGSAVIEVDNQINQISGILTGNTRVTNFEAFNLAGFQGTATLMGSNRLSDRLISGSGNDLVMGQNGNDFLSSNSGNDTLDGGSGNDQMEGDVGDDLYIVDSLGDQVLEGLNAGVDTIQASISFTLGDNVEALQLTGQAARGAGNRGNNVITGNGRNNRLMGKFGNDVLIGKTGRDVLLGGQGNDRLVGDQGRDTLTGGKGKDIFVLTRARKAHLEVIRDFRSPEDTLVIIQDGFSQTLSSGPIRADQFRLGRQAEDSSDRFIYDRSRGALFFDADGLGGVNQVQVARLTNRAALTRVDIVVEA